MKKNKKTQKCFRMKNMQSPSSLHETWDVRTANLANVDAGMHREGQAFSAAWFNTSGMTILSIHCDIYDRKNSLQQFVIDSDIAF